METPKNININVDAGSFIKAVLVLILFYVLFILKDLVLVVLTAVVIASAMEPATKFLGKYRVPRVPSVIFVYLLLVSIFGGIFYFFLPPLLVEVSKLATSLPQYFEFFSPGTINGQANGIVSGISQSLPIKELLSDVKLAASSLSGGVLQFVGTVFGGVTSFILIFIISFYLAVQEKGIENFLQIISPVKHERYVVNLWKRSQKKIGLWMQGQLLLGLFIGVLVYLGLTILGVPYALLLALLAALFELIPLFGPILAAIPAIFLGFVGGGVSLGLMTLGLYAIIQQFENHLIYPLVVRKVVGVAPLVVILALIIGGKLAGFLGLLLAVPIAAALMELVDDIQKEKIALLEKAEKKK